VLKTSDRFAAASFLVLARAPSIALAAAHSQVAVPRDFFSIR
jgi:hypothetical protein